MSNVRNLGRNRLRVKPALVCLALVLFSGCAQSETLIVRDYPTGSVEVMPALSAEDQQKAQTISTLNEYFDLSLNVNDWSYAQQMISEAPYWDVSQKIYTLTFLMDKNTQTMAYGVCLDDQTQEVLAAQTAFDAGAELPRDAEAEARILNIAADWFQTHRPDFDSETLRGIYVRQLENQIGLALLSDQSGKTGYLYMKLPQGQPLAFGTEKFAKDLLLSLEYTFVSEYTE